MGFVFVVCHELIPISPLESIIEQKCIGPYTLAFYIQSGFFLGKVAEHERNFSFSAKCGSLLQEKGKRKGMNRTKQSQK